MEKLVLSEEICKIVKAGMPICDALRDLEPFVHFQKREKDTWRGVTLSKAAG